MARSLRVTRPFSQRLQTLVCEAYPGVPGRRVAAAAATAVELLPSSAEAGRSHEYLRNIRQGRVQQPPAEKAWELGGSLSRLSGKRWLCPTTMLFACGHYGIVADLFLRIPESILDHNHLVSLARALETVTRPTDRNKPVARLTDDIAVREAANWELAMPAIERFDRRVWSIDAHTYGAFSQAWRSQRQSGIRIVNPIVSACQMIADHAEFDVDYRERTAILILLDGLK